MLLDTIAKVAGKTIRGVTLAVGTVGETITNEVKSVPSAFKEGLGINDGKNTENNKSVFNTEPK